MANVQDRGPPSAAAIAIGTALISFVTGYYLGQLRSILPRHVGSGSSHKSPNTGEITHSESDSDGLSEDEALDQGELNAFAGNTEQCKLVLLVRTDLGMSKGKHTALVKNFPDAAYAPMQRQFP